jgi:hypothetical protein
MIQSLPARMKGWGISPVQYEKYEVLETFIRIDMKAGSCGEIEE